jgi:protein-tyrosine-phosphatase
LDKQDGKPTVLFVCIENSSRSVMAEAFARKIGLEASSAGTFPSTYVNPLVVEAMKEVGVDVSQSRPRDLTGEMIEKAGLVVLTDASLEKAIPATIERRCERRSWSGISLTLRGSR